MTKLFKFDSNCVGTSASSNRRPWSAQGNRIPIRSSQGRTRQYHRNLPELVRLCHPSSHGAFLDCLNHVILLKVLHRWLRECDLFLRFVYLNGDANLWSSCWNVWTSLLCMRVPWYSSLSGTDTDLVLLWSHWPFMIDVVINTDQTFSDWKLANST